MDARQEQALNRFFVETFYSIEANEERQLKKAGVTGLSTKELHVLDAVAALEAQGESTMSRVAKRLQISTGALTVAVNVLVQKGYLTRGSDPKDRRLVCLSLTPEGSSANERHAAFHRQMIAQVGELLAPAELDHLVQALERLSGFFAVK